MIVPGDYTRRALYALPVLLAAAVVIAATQSTEHAVGVAAIVLAAALVGPRVTMTDESQHVVAGVTLVPAAVLAMPFTHEVPGTAKLVGVWCAVATWAVFASTSRLVMTQPAWGARAHAAFGALAVLFGGYARLGTLYVGVAWAFVVALLGAMRVTDTARPSLSTLTRREWALAVGVAAATLALSATSALGLPRLHDWMVQRYAHGGDDDASSGFSPWLELGPMQSMALSEDVVLRVFGPAPAYLRGMVYDHYERGHWRNTHSPPTTIVRMPRGPLEGGAVVRVERVGALAGWFFLPLEARGVATENGSVRRDGLGTVRGVPGDLTREVWYRPGPRDTLAPLPPGPSDTAVPASVAGVVQSLAAQWTADATTPAARMEALHATLRGRYRYALRFNRASHVDPVVDFLTRHREGHCEYFASALALLGRAAGVPTRVVGGYRVGEKSPFGGYHLVREKNAHAWVEAWIDGAWRTWDATPPGALPYNERHAGAWWRTAGDYVGLRVRAWFAWATGAGSDLMLMAAAVLLVAWLAWRVWRYRDRDRRTDTRDDTSLRPLPCMEALAGALARVGCARAHDETLERYAARVATSELPEGTRVTAAAALRRYAALRYGADGDETEVAQAMFAAAAAVDHQRQARPKVPVR